MRRLTRFIFEDGVAIKVRCPKCKLHKPFAEHVKDKNGTMGMGIYCLACMRGVDREVQARRRAKHHLNRIKVVYGLTATEFEKMKERQQNLCLICGEPPKPRHNLCVDHDHTTGEVRGLLCMRCNRAIGSFKDDATILQRAAEYLAAKGRI